MTSDRPNPDQLLSQVQAEDNLSRRGKLKIFFGYAAGVGKTYTMLEAAQQAKEGGREVVVGYVEPHGRRETEALLEGLEAIPTRSVEHGGVMLREFDVDAALNRHPDLVLVDELAHTNAPGSRHSKRWQDIVELLEEGINVWTTLNVQHIESLNDIIGQITGITVRETVPDHIFDLATDLELADLTPEELLERLREGKVYLPAQAEHALQHFFQKANLVALRELSLRQTARRLHSEVESARRLKSPAAPWATTDRLLVCVGPSPTTARVIRTAKRMAAALDSPWLAVYVEQAGVTSNVIAQQIADHLRLAERLGADTVTITGSDVAKTILAFARTQNVTKIFIGKTRTPRWSHWPIRGVVDQLLDNSGDIDIYVIQGKEETKPSPPPPPQTKTIAWRSYAVATALVLIASLLAAWLAHAFPSEANIIMVFLAFVAFIAFRLGRGPAIWSSLASVLIFDFFFIPPYFSFAVSDTQYVLTFAVMLAIGLLISTLTAQLQAQLESGRQRERRTLALYRLGKQLSSLSGEVFLVAATGQHLREMVGGEVAIYLRGRNVTDPKDLPVLAYGKETSIAKEAVSVSAAHWVMTHDQIAGCGTDTLPNANALFIPLTGSQLSIGAIALRVDPMAALLQPEQRHWLESCASQLALALERDRMSLEAADARIKAEAEEVRSTLLSGVSHDLKTPLAAIAGASGTLLQLAPTPVGTQRELLDTISEEANRLNRLLENILQISRLDAGAVKPNKQWHLMEEIIGSALRRTKPALGPRRVRTELPGELPLLFVDGLLMEQVFINLFENASRYTPDHTEIMVKSKVEGKTLVVTVTDTGPGLPPTLEKVVFDRYYRGKGGPDAVRGSGLGLAICRAIVHLHQGTIGACNRPEGGAEFVIRLPLAEDSPKLTLE